MTRVSAGLSREDAAELLGVSVRTVGNWETGRARPAYAAFRLLRILRNGDLVDPAWSQFRLVRGKLVTPENHTFEPHELVWQSLLVRMARGFGKAQEQLQALQAQGATVGGAGGRLANDPKPLLGSSSSVPGPVQQGAQQPAFSLMPSTAEMLRTPSLVGDKGGAMGGARCLTPPVRPEFISSAPAANDPQETSTCKDQGVTP